MAAFSKSPSIHHQALKTAATWGSGYAFLGRPSLQRLTLPSLGTQGREITSCKLVLFGMKGSTGVTGTMTARITDNPGLLPNQYTTALQAGSLNKTWWGPNSHNSPTGRNELPLTTNLATLTGYGGSWYLILDFDGPVDFQHNAMASILEGETRDTSVWFNVGGVWKRGEPFFNVGGAWKRSEALINVGGVWKRGI